VNECFVLFGAGAAGRYALKYLRERGDHVIAFADNDPAKHGMAIEGVPVRSPQSAKRDFVCTWIATAISRPAATEIREELATMGVKIKPLWECIPVYHGLPTAHTFESVYRLASDSDSHAELLNQRRFRLSPDYDIQYDPSPKEETYFPPFIKHLDEERFLDCGAADGDTITAFKAKWEKYASIVAMEPDFINYEKLIALHPDVDALPWAVGDTAGRFAFKSNGDYSSSFGLGDNVTCTKLDNVLMEPPTYIKMDIEGAELEALWGARKLLKEHKPVLAICAYHTSDHLWEIPLLIHAIQPDYKLHLRRYAEGAWELVWYAIPAERVIL